MGVWFDVLRYAGAAYLVWLAIKLFRSNGDLAVAVDRARPNGSFFLQGFIVIISNPKMLVLFGAMIPPFITPGGDPMRQILLLGVTFMAIALAGDTAYALLAGQRRGLAVALAHPRAGDRERLLPHGGWHLDGLARPLKSGHAQLSRQFHVPVCGLDLVAVGVAHEAAVVGLAIVMAMAGVAICRGTGGKRLLEEQVDLGLRLGREANMSRRFLRWPACCQRDC